MKIRGIDFVFLNVSDFKRSVNFYQKTLGLKKTSEYKGMWAEFDAGNVTLAIGMYGKGPSPKNRENSVAVALAVNDVGKAVAELKKKKAKIVQPVGKHGICFMAMICDPDGNELILHKRNDGTVG
ncbi:MAG: VOC family protein [bacterium]|nr:VOC family protein [bacterium]